MSNITQMVYYIRETDKWHIKTDWIDQSAELGSPVGFTASIFEYNNITYYPKYIFHNGDVSTERNDFGGVHMDSTIIGENITFNRWIVFCTETEEEATQEEIADISDYIDRIWIRNETKNRDMTEEESNYIKNISITQGCLGDGFATYGNAYSPSLDCNFYTCDFALQIKQGDMICAIADICSVPQVIGRFKVNEKPTYTEDTVSARAVGMMEAFMRNVRVDIKALNEYHRSEIVEKYVNSGKFNYALFESYNYFWEFLADDCLRATGMPLVIDDWGTIKNVKIGEKWAQQLMIPAIESFYKEEDEDGNYTYETTYESSITWEELLSGVAVLLHSNVIEKNGVFYIKKMPELPSENEYRAVFDREHYKNNSTFDKEYVCPSPISVKGNNWYFYQKQNGEMVGFGYIDGDGKVTLNNGISNISNVSYYPVAIECPWILFETLDRDPQNYSKNFNMSAFMGHIFPVKFRSLANEMRGNKAFVYSPANVLMSGWHPFFSAGNIIPVKDYDGITRYVYVGEITISYDGGVATEITSPCNVDTSGASNTSSSGSSGTSSYSNGVSAFSSGANMAFQLGVTIQDGVIKGSQIIDSTLTGAKIKDAEIGFEKVNKSFISDLTSDKAYVDDFTARIGEFNFLTTDELSAEVAKINSLTANDAIIQNIFSNSIISDKAVLDVLQANVINADYIKGAVADVGYITADSADLRYADITFANIDTANINKEKVGLLFAEVGLLDRATIVEGHVTGYLSSVKINADVIDAGTLSTDRLLVTGDDGIVYKINVNSSGLSMSELQDEKYKKYLNGTDIVAGSITANEIDVENLFAQDIVASGTITGATLIGTHAEIDDGYIGNFIISSQIKGLSYEVPGYPLVFDLGHMNSMDIGDEEYGICIGKDFSMTKLGVGGIAVYSKEGGEAQKSTKIYGGTLSVNKIQASATSKIYLSDNLIPDTDNITSIGESGKRLSSVYANYARANHLNTTTLTTSGSASTSGYGVTKLSSSTASTSTSLAATPSAVKVAYDKGTSAFNGKGFPYAIFAIASEITYTPYTGNSAEVSLLSSGRGDRTSTFSSGGANFIYCPFSGIVDIHCNWYVGNASSNGYLYARCYQYNQSGNDTVLDFCGMGCVTPQGSQATGSMKVHVTAGKYIYISQVCSVSAKTTGDPNNRIRLQYTMID